MKTYVMLHALHENQEKFASIFEASTGSIPGLSPLLIYLSAASSDDTISIDTSFYDFFEKLCKEQGLRVDRLTDDELICYNLMDS